MSRYTTKSTYLGKGKWGCRVFVDGELWCEAVVASKASIAPAFRDLMRSADILTEGNSHTMAARDRMNLDKNKPYYLSVTHYWQGEKLT